MKMKLKQSKLMRHCSEQERENRGRERERWGERGRIETKTIKSFSDGQRLQVQYAL